MIVLIIRSNYNNQKLEDLLLLGQFINFGEAFNLK